MRLEAAVTGGVVLYKADRGFDGMCNVVMFAVSLLRLQIFGFGLRSICAI